MQWQTDVAAQRTALKDKSTIMAAVGDLLFGFPGRTTYDFRHDQQLLRVGGVVQAGEVELECRRRKGNKATLLNGADEPIDEALITSLLAGYTAETFSRMFSLDHHRLREGGRAIIEAKDDIGQASLPLDAVRWFRSELDISDIASQSELHQHVAVQLKGRDL